MKITKQRLKQMIREELEMALDEEETTKTSKRTLGDKKTQIVQSWISYKFGKIEIQALIKVLKTWNVPKSTAMQIIKAPDEGVVAKLVDALPTE